MSSKSSTAKLASSLLTSGLSQVVMQLQSASLDRQLIVKVATGRVEDQPREEGTIDIDCFAATTLKKCKQHTLRPDDPKTRYARKRGLTRIRCRAGKNHVTRKR